MNKILLVDDEPKILSMTAGFLVNEGFTVVTATSGREALDVFEREQPVLVVLDWMMPDVDGLSVLREIRKKSQVHVILLTAKAEEIDKVIGLEIGADDYVTKPFSLRELTARIKAVLRKLSSVEARPESIKLGGMEIELASHVVKINGRECDKLTPTEFDLLCVLAKHPGKIFTRLQLMDLALGEAYEGYERSLDTHIRNLRKKIEEVPSNPQYIQTVYGVGYKASGVAK